MTKLFTHPVAKPIIHGVLILGASLLWADGGLQWFLPRYIDWVLRQVHGLPWVLALPLAGGLGVIAVVIVLATIRLPVDLLTLAKRWLRRSNARRSGT